MLSQRACRIVQTASSSSQSGDRPQGDSVKLSPTERISRWRNIYVKLVLLMRHLENVNRLKHYFGANIWNNLFPSTKAVEPPPKQKYTRVIDGELVGEQIADSESKFPAKVEQAMCQHPPTKDGLKIMRKGGNQSGKKWWTCQDCHARWNRYPLSRAETMEPDALAILTFGQHAGREFGQVETVDPDYCKWVLMTYEKEPTVCEGLKAFALYLLAKEWQAVPMGRPHNLTTAEKLDMELDDLVDKDLL